MVLEKSLCELEQTGFLAHNLKDYKKLVRYGKFVCTSCGRVARKKKNLCNPERLYAKDQVKSSQN